VFEALVCAVILDLNLKPCIFFMITELNNQMVNLAAFDVYLTVFILLFYSYPSNLWLLTGSHS